MKVTNNSILTSCEENVTCLPMQNCRHNASVFCVVAQSWLCRCSERLLAYFYTVSKKFPKSSFCDFLISRYDLTGSRHTTLLLHCFAVSVSHVSFTRQLNICTCVMHKFKMTCLLAKCRDSKNLRGGKVWFPQKS